MYRRIIAPCAIVLALSTLCGCFSIVRIPTPKQEWYDDDGNCTNRVWESCMRDLQRKSKRYGWSAAFPTVQMRCHATYMMYFAPPSKPYEEMTGEEKHREKMCK